MTMPRAVLLVGKTALARGLPLDVHAFPDIGVPPCSPIGPALSRSIVYSVARTESEFNQRVVSPAKAVGLMQVTPEAGRDTAKRFGVTYDWDRLVSDPVYNTQMGAAELAALLQEYRGSYIMSFAGYNAGRGRVQKWIAQYGDPRDAKVDAIDWVERIPFAETRNYVQRVMENLDRSTACASATTPRRSNPTCIAARRLCRASGLTHLLVGDFAVARSYLDQGLALYDAAERASYASIYATTDPLIFFRSYLSLALVCCGHLGQARSCSDSALTYARSLSHAHSLGFALHWTWVAGRCAGLAPTALLSQADELMVLSDERSFMMWRALARAFRGWCLTALGQPDQGIAQMTAGLTEVQANGKLHVPHVLTLLGDAHRMAGQPRVALAYVAEAEQLAEATQSKWLQAETLRLRGELLVIVGDSAGAEASLLKAIALAQRQGAKLFELRASTSLARLLHDQGRHKEAGELLLPISGWCNDGFDAPDLTGSKALLAAIDFRLGCRRAPPSSWDS